MATASERIFCFGGGTVTAEEIRLASADVPPRHFACVPVKRWKRVEASAVGPAGAPLAMEESSVTDDMPGVVLL